MAAAASRSSGQSRKFTIYTNCYIIIHELVRQDNELLLIVTLLYTKLAGRQAATAKQEAPLRGSEAAPTFESTILSHSPPDYPFLARPNLALLRWPPIVNGSSISQKIVTLPVDGLPAVCLASADCREFTRGGYVGVEGAQYRHPLPHSIAGLARRPAVLYTRMQCSTELYSTEAIARKATYT